MSGHSNVGASRHPPTAPGGFSNDRVTGLMHTANNGRSSHVKWNSASRQHPNPEDSHPPSTAGSKSRRPSTSFRSGATSPQHIPRSKRGMTGMLDIDRAHTRRDRTFAGSECAVCEEPLEHTLRGEKVLQLSCGHVSHEACFYEYIREFDAQTCPTCTSPLGLDSSRGGNVLDIEKLSSIVRSLHVSNGDNVDNGHKPSPSNASQYTNKNNNHRESRAEQYPPSVYGRRRHGRSGGSDSSHHGHARNESNGTEITAGPQSTIGPSTVDRRHDSRQAPIEAATASPRLHLANNPIPHPSVLIRSEYPTLNRSRQQQSLTCLITVEMPEGKWKPNPEDLKRIQAQAGTGEEERTHRKNSKVESEPIDESPEESPEVAEELDRLTENLLSRVDNWHGLDYTRFGRLRLHDTLQVGKDRQSWQELECYLFGEMLICVKEKRSAQQHWDPDAPRTNKCTLKGSIMIKKHLDDIEYSLDDDNILTLSLSVAELPTFHLHFPSHEQLEIWRDSLYSLSRPEPTERGRESDDETILSTEYDDNGRSLGRHSSVRSSYGANKSYQTAPTDYAESHPTSRNSRGQGLSYSLHVPIDVILVIPLSSSMHGLKITLLRDVLRFMLYSLGERDRMGLVSFGASGGAVPIVGLTTKSWNGWNKVVESIKAAGPKGVRADPVEGANVAMDLLMQRKTSNPLSSILIVSDSGTSENEGVDFVVSRAEAARVSIYTFGLGLTHRPDALIDLSQRTKAAYLYVKDWMMLRECVAGVLGSLQSICHQNVILKLRLPDGSPGKFVKISGALLSSTRATGREAEASLGDLRFGEKRDVLVQLAIAPESSSDNVPQDAWESIVSDLEALGGPSDQSDSRGNSIEEVPMIQADLRYGDILRDGAIAQTPRPSLLTITVLPAPSRNKNNGRPPTPPIPPHPSVVQRRMELLTSDMLTRALTLVSRGQNDRAHHLLQETRSILKGLGKGGLPPVPPSRTPSRMNLAASAAVASSASSVSGNSPPASVYNDRSPTSAPPNPPLTAAHGIDISTMSALDAELEAALEWINHPAVFARDPRKAVLQTIGVASSQRAYTFRTGLESIWADRILGIRAMAESAKAWRESGSEALMEEA